MDSADQIRTAVSKQGAILGTHEDALQFLLAKVNSLTDEQEKMQSAVQNLQSATAPVPEPIPSTSAPVSAPPPPPQPIAESEPLQTPMFRDAASPEPEPFAGGRGGCSGFLLQCELAFGRSPRSFVSDTVRISYLVGKLRDRALTWAEAYLARHPLPTCHYDDFLREFKKTFAHPTSECSSARKLLHLRQGRRSIADFLIDFRIAAAEAGWSDRALHGVYLHSLNDEMKDHLASRDEPATFEELVSLTLRIDSRLREREWERDYSSRRSLRRSSPVVSPPPPLPVQPSTPIAGTGGGEPEPEPMQIGRYQLTVEERERRRRSRSCFYCGSGEHLISSCPKKGNETARR